MVERSDEDVLAGILRIPIGGETRAVPTLKLRAVRDWQALVAERMALIRPALGADPEEIQDLAHVANLALENILDIVVAYDVTGALGGREWLEEHADPAQLYAAVHQMGKVTFPFVGDAVALVAAFPTAFGARPSDSTSSTNGHSPTGDSTPEPSKSVSTPTSSR